MDKRLEVVLAKENGRITHLFRSESEFQKEGKGGFLKGYVKINRNDDEDEIIEKIELSLISGHPSEIHCNLIRISNNSFQKDVHRRDGHISEDIRQRAMSPSAYKVILVRASDDKFQINRKNHEYLPDNYKEVQFWDENNHTLYLGDNCSRFPGLCLNIVRPLSKESESSKNFAHIREVLKTRKREELELILNESDMAEEDKQQRFKKEMDDFNKNQLNASTCATHRKKRKLTNLETILADGEMHKTKLKVVIYIRDNNKLNNDNLRKYAGYSEWILAKNRFGFEIDKAKTILTMLTNASIQAVTVDLKTCKFTSKLTIHAEFMHRQMFNDNGSTSTANDNQVKYQGSEIEIMKVNGTSVHRNTIDGKTGALRIFVKTNMGINQGCIPQDFLMKLTILDESGCICAEDTVDIIWILHTCYFDDALTKQDADYGDIIDINTIKGWLDSEKLRHLPCPLCKVVVLPGRCKYLDGGNLDKLKEILTFGKSVVEWIYEKNVFYIYIYIY